MRQAARWGRREFVSRLTLAGTASLVGVRPDEPAAEVTRRQIISFENSVDLTHTLIPECPYIPVPGITFPFNKIPIATIEKQGVAANRWEIHEHIGTQIDAPAQGVVRRRKVGRRVSGKSPSHSAFGCDCRRWRSQRW
jgi:hypothetical protein